MDTETTSPAPPCTSDHSTTPDEKRAVFSKELTSPEHSESAPETKDKSKNIKSFLPWLKNTKGSGSPVNVVENAQAAEALVPASFLSLFRLDNFMTDTGQLFTDAGIQLASKSCWIS